MSSQEANSARRLLLVEDDPALGPALALALSRRGYLIAQAADGALALSRAREESFQAIVLDLTLPEMDGMEVLKTLRAEGHTVPILVLTARAAVGDRVLGLKAGADDYLGKPFDVEELDARLQALLRRASAAQMPRRQVGALTLNQETATAFWEGTPLDLSPREFTLLASLLERPGHAVARERLFDRVFADSTDVLPDAIEVVAYRLRKKLASTPFELIALRGVGYLIRERG